MPEHILAQRDVLDVETRIIQSDIESPEDALSLAFDYLMMSINKSKSDISYYGEDVPDYLVEQLACQYNALIVAVQVGRLGEVKEFLVGRAETVSIAARSTGDTDHALLASQISKMNSLIPHWPQKNFIEKTLSKPIDGERYDIS